MELQPSAARVSGAAPDEEQQLFLARIRARSDESAAHAAILVAGRVNPDGRIVLVYRERTGGELLGRLVDLDEMKPLFDPNDPEWLADVVFSDEMSDPSGPGERLAVDWADGLVENPDHIGWHVSAAVRPRSQP